MPPQPLEAPKNVEAAPGEVWAELERVCHSATFSRSRRLQQFLRYVCECTLRGEASLLKEYALARDIFERGPDYVTREDSIVRRQAHSLRRKLQEYYEKEGRSDPVRIELPVGHYVPLFQVVEISSAESQLANPESETPPPPQCGSLPVPLGAAAVLLTACLVFAAGWYFSQRAVSRATPPSALDAAIREIWSPWLHNSAGVSICFSNRMMAIIKFYENPVAVSEVTGRMRASPAEDSDIRRAFSLPLTGYIYLTPSLEQTKMGEAVSAVYLANFLVAAQTPVRTAESRFVNWETLRTGNMILFGYPENNPLVEPLLSKYPFRLLGTDGDRLRRIVNVHPLRGEPSEFQMHLSRGPNDPGRDYALISMLPGVDGAHQLLLISGLESECTSEATEYLTDPAKARVLLHRLRQAAPAHRGPWRFQMVLETEIRDKVTTAASVAAVRVL